MSPKTEQIIKRFLLVIIGTVIIGYIAFFQFPGGIDKLKNENLLNSKPQLNTKKYKRVGPIRDLSYSNITRKEVRITIEKGLSEEEVKSILEEAAHDINREIKNDALSIKCFVHGENFMSGPYTVGEVIFAPNGKWEDAGIKGKKQLQINLASIYFKNIITSYPPVGSEIVLVSTNNELIKLSNDRDDWSESRIISRVKPGTKAKLELLHSEALTPDNLLIRAYVQVKNKKGWVHGGNIKK
ncbi:MAG: hypothetical protein JXB49_37825 [Bacteroidales bacterium]|nr:hypothetical protein [Bacteroidales bacterium]